ncbi:MAG: type B 50S ribosomal protein L31 [Bacteroidales bacterium]|nr:type B 50S ribosomal protein L31 [Bacteroidales bacterium]
MKKGIHPDNYRLVAFRDMSNGHTFVTKSAANTRETVKLDDGVEYPLIKIEISNTSHPFYTGKMKLVDTAGRVDKYMNRYKDHLAKNKINRTLFLDLFMSSVFSQLRKRSFYFYNFE